MKKQSKHETTLDIASWLMSLTKGHERYPHDTVKIDGFPISYKDVENLAKRIKNAYRRDMRRKRKRVCEMVNDIWWKNKNILKFWETLKGRDVRDNDDAANFAMAITYAADIEHLIQWYGFKKKATAK